MSSNTIRTIGPALVPIGLGVACAGYAFAGIERTRAQKRVEIELGPETG